MCFSFRHESALQGSRHSWVSSEQHILWPPPFCGHRDAAWVVLLGGQCDSQ